MTASTLATPAPPAVGDDVRRDSFPLRRSELLLIVAFWAFFAAITAASRLLDPRGPGPDSPVALGFATLAVVQSTLWAILTPPLFLLAGRYGSDRTHRLTYVALFLVAAVAAAVLVNLAVGWIRHEVIAEFFPLPSRRGGRGRPPGRIDPFGVLNDFITATGIIAAGLARDYSLRYRARKEQAARLAAETARLQAQLAEARLDALRRQLDPHFLFNTLNAISALVERDPRGVRRMIARLSELLRHSIEGAGEPEIPLERELELLQRYVDIMQVRFQGRLEVTTQVDERARDALVPNLILQPLVENAIKHGVSKVEGVGRITLEAERVGADLVLRVRDNGPGPQPGGNGAGEAPSGVGLRNTVARLEQLYGPHQRFALRPAEEGGTAAELALPYHTRADLRAAVDSPNA
jgi:two-component sensor histidine kinase